MKGQHRNIAGIGITIALVAGSCAGELAAQASPINGAADITLTPAVIAVKGLPGQTFSQQLTLSNNTPYELSFHMQAQDVVVREGKRVFLPAGEEQGGIARSAVFTHEDMIAAPGNSVTTQVTITIPTAPGSRAIACIFMGKSLLSTSTSVTMTASLGALVTFNLGSNYRLESQPLQVQVDSDAKTLTFHEQVTNSGSDPMVPQGVIALTNEHGALVARLPVNGQRLLPGESIAFTAEHPALPKAGKYKATLLMQYESTFFSNATEFIIQ